MNDVAPSFGRAGPTDATTTYAQVSEGVRATIATYAQALDDGRTDDVVATFCLEGRCDIPGLGAHQGHDALREAFAKTTPRRPQRHVVVNTVVSEWNDDQAEASSDLIFLLLGDSGWKVELVGRYHDILHHEDGTWRFHHRSATFVTERS